MNENLTLVLERIKSLERTTRRLRGAIGALIAVGAVLLIMGQTAPKTTPPEVIEPEEFRLVDSSGEIRGRWFAHAFAGTMIMLQDARGAPRVFAGVSGDDRALLELHGKDYRTSIQWQVAPDGSTAFRFSNGDGKTSGKWWVRQDGTTALRLRDKDEKVIFEAPLIETDERQDQFWPWLFIVFPLLVVALG